VASRARQNSIQSGPDNNKPRSALPTSSKTNGIQPEVPEPAPPVITTQEVNNEPAPVKEPVPVAKPEAPKKEPEKPTEAAPVPPPSAVKKETKAEELERRKSESLPPGAPGIPTVTTKSGRASKPSTPAMANLQEPPRPRASRNGDSNGKKGHRKTNSMAHLAPPTADDEMTSGDGEFDADEPTYCYCNGVSYGEMVACDSDECTREWFHLACVGLKVAPGEKSKFYTNFPSRMALHDACFADWAIRQMVLRRLQGTSKNWQQERKRPLIILGLGLDTIYYFESSLEKLSRAKKGGCSRGVSMSRCVSLLSGRVDDTGVECRATP
jgi:hypothetical protein